MKKLFIAIILFFNVSVILSQTEEIKIYNENADARAEIKAALEKAKADNKNVLLQIGGNWCPWCVKLHGMETTDMQIDSLLNANYVMVMVNVPREKDKRDPDLMASLGNPQRFGFPVLVVLNQEGERIHTQDSWYLEQDKSYDRDKLIHFLKMWSVTAVAGGK
jgi:uncharacterized protein YyaL (SSP411 family)